MLVYALVIAKSLDLPVLTPESNPMVPASEEAHWFSQWSIAVYTGAHLTALQPTSRRPALTVRDVTDIDCRTVADPFLLVVDGRWFVFFEVWNAASDRGEIAYATSDDGLAWTYGAVVLREPCHLSYPHVFEADGAIYMVPETRQDKAVRLYVAEAFPGGWRPVATLVEGLLADATLVRHEDRWWMFAQRGLDELRLYSSETLDRGWREHPASPLWPGNRRRTRPGGRVLMEDGRMMRFAQDAWPHYGYCLRAFAIDRLTPTAYEEHEVEGSPILSASRTGWNSLGMHHLDAVRRPDGSWLAVVDGAAPGTIGPRP